MKWPLVVGRGREGSWYIVALLVDLTAVEVLSFVIMVVTVSRSDRPRRQ